MKEIYIKAIAEKIGVRDWQVENCAKLFEEGATIPFVSRYRKESQCAEVNLSVCFNASEINISAAGL